MMSTSVILALSDEAAARAARLARRPYTIFNNEEIDRYPPIPFPDIGSYNPPGWKLLQKENGETRFFFVDTTGMDLRGPAMSIDDLKRALKRTEDEAREAKEIYGYAIIEKGQFQLCIGIFRKTGEPEQEEVDEDEVLSEMEYEAQLRIIEDVLSHFVDSKYTAAPQPEDTEPWPERVHVWLYENNDYALDICDGNTYMPNLTLRRCLPPLIELGLLEEDSDLLLRDVDIDGHRLRMWDCQEKHRPGMPQNAICYCLNDPEGNVIFLASDFGSNCIDDDDAVRSLISFLTVCEGDVEDDYFQDYTKKQREWRDKYAEELSMWGVDPSEFEDDPYTYYEVDGEETRFKPWGWEEPKEEKT